MQSEIKIAVRETLRSASYSNHRAVVAIHLALDFGLLA